MSQMPDLVAAHVEEVVRRQNDAIDAACWDAVRYGYSVRVTHYWSHLPYIGIELVPGPVRIEYLSVWS